MCALVGMCGVHTSLHFRMPIAVARGDDARVHHLVDGRSNGGAAVAQHDGQGHGRGLGVRGAVLDEYDGLARLRREGRGWPRQGAQCTGHVCFLPRSCQSYGCNEPVRDAARRTTRQLTRHSTSSLESAALARVQACGHSLCAGLQSGASIWPPSLCPSFPARLPPCRKRPPFHAGSTVGSRHSNRRVNAVPPRVCRQ